ncbi:twin-arginine translocation signal domain-containing protein [Natronomonas halophila]|uniref:right-handed parallel beta-helix repeat-containing protein n=1 Tax=Natronomonas halophila TaxID=2747817 RepID=UPI0015B3FDE4|nr:right-handed parallel beta-helix repeat-containing protein [Natronomonas halophila]QLD87133.1 twin-arginine translocation signal domain-containing protein [Natronomonas halophila]
MKEKFEEAIGDVERRDVLRGAGIAGGAGVLGVGLYGATRDDPGPEDPPETPDGTEEPTEEPDEPPPEERFDTVVNAVEAGADPDGNEPINFLFEEYDDDSTLFVFQSGTYEMEPFQIADRTQVGLVKSGDERPRFVPTEGGCRGGHPYVFFNGVGDLLLEDIRFDFRDTDSGGPLHFYLEGESTIRNVTYEGSCENQLGIVRIDVNDPDGSALVENFHSVNIRGDKKITGMYVSDNHSGELTFRDCQVNGFSDNGLYASAPGAPNGGDGLVNVIGGTYRNNNIANVRLGSTGAKAQDVTVVVDGETTGWGQLNARGIRLRNKSGQRIDNCEISFEADAADSFGAVVIHGSNGGGTVTDTDIRLDRDDVPAVRAFPPKDEPDQTPVFDGVSITGDAGSGVIAEIAGRDGTVFRNCTIEQSGADRRGFLFRDSQNCRIVDSSIAVGKQPATLDDSSLTIENTTIATANDEQFFEELQLEDESLTL